MRSVCVPHILFIHLSTSGCTGCFYRPTIVNRAARKVGPRILVRVRITKFVSQRAGPIYSLPLGWEMLF